MVSFELSEVEALTQSMLREMGQSDVRPLAQGNDEAGRVAQAIIDTLWSAGLVQALAEVSPEPRSRVLSCVMLEELGWADASTAVAIGSAMGFVQAVQDQGSEAQREMIVDRLAAGAPLHAAVLVQESGLNGHPGALGTTLADDSGKMRLTGRKSFVPLADQCESFLVVCRSERGVEAVVVPRDADGVTVEEPKGTLGLKGLALASVAFDGVELSRDARLGGDNGCDASALIASSRVGLASVLTGVSKAVFEHSVPYTKERVAHGTALARKQSVAFRLADMFIDVPAMRWMTWRAAVALQKGRNASREARLAQIYCGERALAIADEGVQLMGGHGYIRDNPVERWLRDARTLSLLEGCVGV